MFESVVVVAVGADAGVVEASEDFSKLANGMPLLLFSPPFFASLPFLHSCASVENGGMLFFESLACWSIGAAFCRVSTSEAMEAKPAGCQLLISCVDVDGEE